MSPLTGRIAAESGQCQGLVWAVPVAGKSHHPGPCLHLGKRAAGRGTECYDHDMFWRMAKAVLILPGTALIYVPVLIHWFGERWPFGSIPVTVWGLVLAAILAAPAFALAIATMRLFIYDGEGTPAPWDPPRNFVVSGPYRYVRNPMLTAVILMIIAEAAALQSLPLLGWAVVFFFLNTLYFVFVEEPGLEQRFGETYLQYKASVPRWIPKLQPFQP